MVGRFEVDLTPRQTPSVLICRGDFAQNWNRDTSKSPFDAPKKLERYFAKKANFF